MNKYIAFFLIFLVIRQVLNDVLVGKSLVWNEIIVASACYALASYASDMYVLKYGNEPTPKSKEVW